MEAQQQQSHRFPWIYWVVLSITIALTLGLAGVITWLVVTQNLAQLSVIVGLIASIVAIVSAPLIFYFTIFKKPEKQGPLPSSPKKETETPQTHPSGTIWNVPYRRNLYFTGREEALRALHERFSTTKTSVLSQSQAMSGLGGVGKTQIAVEYAYRHREEYRCVLWVNAATRDTIIASFLEVATLLALPQQQEANQNKVIAAVTHWFREHDRWLLIFDNADDLTLADEFLPPSDTGFLLLTTRHQAPATLADSLDIETMHQDEGALLVLRRAKLLARDAPLAQARPEDRAQAARIVEVMDGLPLALDQAGAYIEETRCTLPAFLETYQRQSAEILRRRGRSGKEHPLPVATTWSLSFVQVQQLNPAAADLLRVCSFLAHDAIPEELILDGATELGPLLATWQNDTTQLDEAIGTLSGFSLVRRDREERAISLHRLVQAAQLLDMDESTRRIWAERTVRALNQAFPHVDFTTWPQCERLLPHATRCVAFIERYRFAFPEAARLLNQTAFYLHERAQYPEAEPLYQRALAISEQALGPNHPDTATNLNNLAGLYKSQGKYEQAEPLYQRALAIREQALGPNHPDTATSLNNLAGLYDSQGKYEQAEPLYQRALAIREQALGPNHPDTAGSLNNLAGLYDHQGEYAKAEPLLKRALTIYEQVLGPNHPTTIVVRANHAHLLESMKHKKK